MNGEKKKPSNKQNKLNIIIQSNSLFETAPPLIAASFSGIYNSLAKSYFKI